MTGQATSATEHSIVPSGKWRIDPARSRVGFSVRHMMFSTAKGRFTDFEGTLESDGAGAGRASGVVRTASIDTGEGKRDETLRGADLFDVAAYPEIRFASTRIEPLDGHVFRILGELTIKGVGREVEFEASVRRVPKSPGPGDNLTIEVGGEIQRSDFGLAWADVFEAGGALVSDRVRLQMDIRAAKI